MPPKKDPTKDYDPGPLPPPAATLEDREAQLVHAAMNLVEFRMHSGSASAQETVHFLRLGSVKNQLEQDRLRSENLVLQTRVKEMESRTSTEGAAAAALNAFRGYSGEVPIEDDEDDHPNLY